MACRPKLKERRVAEREGLAALRLPRLHSPGGLLAVEPTYLLSLGFESVFQIPSPLKAFGLSVEDGGERGIRTLETVARLHEFQSCAFDHSATSPRNTYNSYVGIFPNTTGGRCQTKPVKPPLKKSLLVIQYKKHFKNKPTPPHLSYVLGAKAIARSPGLGGETKTRGPIFSASQPPT